MEFWTIGFGVVGVIGLAYALFEGRRARRAERHVVEIEQAMTSYRYLKDKALQLYENGNYAESLDVFKKYLLNNTDEKDWSEIIALIMAKETKRMFQNELMTQGVAHTATIITYFITHESRFKDLPKYPPIAKELDAMYTKAFNKTVLSRPLLFALTDRDYATMSKLAEKGVFISNTEVNKKFVEMLTAHCAANLAPDNFEDDIPF